MNDAAEILRKCRCRIAPETYNLVSLDDAEWKRLLENPELSPRMSAPFMIFRDAFEVTLMLDDTDFTTIRHAVRDAKIERGFRMLTFETVLDFTVVGFMAEISRILAQAGISILPLSAFSRDHLLIKQDDLVTALKALGPHVSELC